MWWVRGLVLDVQVVERPGEQPGSGLKDTIVQVSDVDNPDDGYEIRFEGMYHSYELNDAVVLIGHEPQEKGRISYPRVCVNHNTGLFDRVYPPAGRMVYGRLTVAEWKFWLSAKTPVGVAGGIKNLISLLLGPVGLFGCFLWPGLLFLVAAFFPFVLMGWLALRSLTMALEQPRFSGEGKKPKPYLLKNLEDWVKFDYVDLTPLYEELANRMHIWAIENPDEEGDFQIVPRGQHMIGALT